MYHRALSIAPNNSFCSEMLTVALSDLNTYIGADAEYDAEAQRATDSFVSDGIDNSDCSFGGGGYGDGGRGFFIPQQSNTGSSSIRGMRMRNDSSGLGSSLSHDDDTTIVEDEDEQLDDDVQHGRDQSAAVDESASGMDDSVASFSRVVGRLSMDSRSFS